MKIKFFSLIGIAILISSCVSTIKINSIFYNPTKVGIVVNVDTIRFSKTGNQGLLDMALTPGNKYTVPLKTVDPFVNPTNKIKNEIQNIFGSKNKQLEFINEKVNINELNNFEKPANAKGKYFNKDLRGLKAKYDVEEIMFINVSYGLLVGYYGFIELNRSGYSSINALIVNLNDNLLLFKDNTYNSQMINGDWKTPPNYDNLKNSIQTAIDNSINTLKTKL